MGLTGRQVFAGRRLTATLASTAAALLVVAGLGGCGVGVGDSAASPKSVADSPALPTLTGPCTIRSGNTCNDVMADAGSFDSLSLANMTMTNASFRTTSLVSASLESSKAQFADFTGAHMSLTSLRNADLTGSRFDGADLTGADLRGAKLDGASFRGTTLDNAKMSGARVDTTTCATAVGGVCATGAPGQGTLLLSGSSDILTASLNITSDSTGLISGASATYQLSKPVPQYAPIYAWAIYSGSSMCMMYGLTAAPAPSSPPTAFDATQQVLAKCPGIRWSQGAHGNLFLISSSGGWAPTIDAPWTTSAASSSFVAKASQSSDDFDLAYEVDGDGTGAVTKATVTAAAKSFAGPVGSVQMSITPPKGTEQDASITLDSPPGPGDPAKTWDVTSQVLAAAGKGPLPALTTFGAQFFGPDNGGSVGDPMVAQWMSGSATSSYQMSATGTSVSKGGTEKVVILSQSGASISSAQLTMQPDATLSGTTTVTISAQVPPGDTKPADVVVPVNMATLSSQALAAAPPQGGGRAAKQQYDQAVAKALSTPTPVKSTGNKGVLIASPSSVTLDLTSAILAKWPGGLLPPNSVLTVTPSGPTGPTGAALTGSWLSGQIPVGAGAKITSDVSKASLNGTELACYDPGTPDSAVTPPVPTTLPSPQEQPAPSPSPASLKYSCTFVRGIDFTKAANVNWKNIWGASLTGVTLGALGATGASQVDMRWVALTGATVPSITNVDFSYGALDASVPGDIYYLTATQATVQLRHGTTSTPPTIYGSDLTGSAMTFSAQYSLSNTCARKTFVMPFDSANPVDHVDFSNSQIDGALERSKLTNVSFQQATFDGQDSFGDDIRGNTFTLVNFQGANLNSPNFWVSTNTYTNTPSKSVPLSGGGSTTVPDTSVAPAGFSLDVCH
ncbi:MAG: pentapeptide repeat-containing protein [Actinomycetes bacterium]